MRKAFSKNRTDERRPIRRLVKFLCVIMICITAFMLSDYILAEIADKNAVYSPKSLSAEEKTTINNLIKSESSPSDEDYIKIFEYTGLGQVAVDKLRNEGFQNSILFYADNFQKQRNYICNRNGILTYDEYITDGNGNLSGNPVFADLENGDVLITLSIHTFGYRHGHAAVVTDAQRGQIAHSVRFGVVSRQDSIAEYAKYPLVAVLRLKGNSGKTAEEIAEYISDELMDIPYNILALASDKSEKKAPGSTQCAHFIWYAYKKFGIDINSDGGHFVTPTDILESDEFDIVQIYGFDPALFSKEMILTKD